VRRGLLEVADDAFVGAVVVDDRLLEVVGEEVADNPYGSKNRNHPRSPTKLLQKKEHL
jgi:pyrimidine deaminase RibD-like protein